MPVVFENIQTILSLKAPHKVKPRLEATKSSIYNLSREIRLRSNIESILNIEYTLIMGYYGIYVRIKKIRAM